MNSAKALPPTPDWTPFRLAPRTQKSDPPRPIETREGVGDRLRAAAFAEIQAREAFLWAAQHFSDAPEPLRESWRRLAFEEDKHLRWLLERLEELHHSLDERAVSDNLWVSLVSCKSAKEFSLFMASAEERGRRAGERFKEQLALVDPRSSLIFGQIALEEVAHIELAMTYFPEEAEMMRVKAPTYAPKLAP